MSESDNIPASKSEKSADDVGGAKRHSEPENVRVSGGLVLY